MVIRKVSIFILLTKAVLLVSAKPDLENYRLPDFYNVLDYRLFLHLPSTLFTENGTEFSGEVEIRFEFTNVTDYIALHSHHHMIKLHEISFEKEELPSSNYSVNNVTDILTINIGRQVTTNITYHLYMKYTAIVNTEGLSGLYKSRYVDRYNVTRFLLATQLGATARNVFPCFNEPRFKAYFKFKIAYPLGLSIFFSSRPVLTTPNIVLGMSSTEFRRTPRVSPGSLAFLISDMSCTRGDSNITALRVCSRDKFSSQRNLALYVTPKLLASLNSFTNYNYDEIVGKLHIVAVPDFPAAASANLGLQLHREAELLWDKFESSNKSREDITIIIAHELAHQWFGNLLTFKWYSELFMAEGFARYFEYYTVNEVFPQYEVGKRFVTDILQKILVDDGTGDASPLHIENVTTMSDIGSTYSDIPYNKGSSILRMVSYFMSPENFKKGIQNFVQKYKYSNVDSENLWTELNKTIVNSVSKMPANLSTVMRNWIWESGYPLVHVSLNGRRITISQSKFSYSGLDNKTKWYVPISYTESNHLGKFRSTTPDFWLTPDSDFHHKFPLLGDWFMLNNQQIGYYRVNYDKILWTRIKAALQKRDFDGIIDINRAQIVDDLFNLARADIVPYSFVLNTIRFLKNDWSYYPWKAAIDGFEFLLRRVGEYTELGKMIAKDMLNLMDYFYNSVPISIRKEDDHFYTLKQLLAADWACRLGHEDCVKDAVEMFKAYKDSGKRPPAELRYIIYCNGLRYSNDDSDWYFMWEAFLIADQPSEQKVIRTTLGCSMNSTLLKNYLQKTITKNSGIRSQDALHVFTAVAGNPAGVDVAFNFLIDNQEEVARHYQTMGSVEYIFTGITERLTTEEQLNKVTEIINKGRLKEEFKQFSHKVLSITESTRAWLRKYSDDLTTYYNVDTFNYEWFYLFLLVIPISFIAVFIYLWMRRREELLIWFATINPMNIRLRGNHRAPAGDMPMQDIPRREQ